MGVLIIDDVPFDFNRSSEIRPHMVWGLSQEALVGNHLEFSERLQREPQLAEQTLVAAHIGDLRAERIVEGVKAAEFVALKVCAAGGRMLFFSGEQIERLWPGRARLLEGTGRSLVEKGFEENKHFAAAYWGDIDGAEIKSLAFEEVQIDEDWRIDSVFFQVPSATRDFLGAIEALCGANEPLSERLVQSLKGLDGRYLRRTLLERRRPAGHDMEAIEDLLEWLSGALSLEEPVPGVAEEWIAAVRRTLRSAGREWTAYETFSRIRERLNHAIFGNDFARKLGPNADFLVGYWRALSKVSCVGDQDSRQSVEIAFERWVSVRSELRRFIASPWPIEKGTGSKGELMNLVGTIDRLVEDAPGFAFRGEEERRDFKRQILAAIEGTRDILRSFRIDDEQCERARAENTGRSK